MGSCTYPITMGHILTTSDVQLLQYVKSFHDDQNTASNQMKNSPIPKDLNTLSSHPNMSKNTSSQSSSDSTENNRTSNDVTRKQNMSLPPHWRTEQPVRHQDGNGEIQSTTENTENKYFGHENVTYKLLCGDLKYDKINRKVLSLSEEMVEHYQQPDMD